MDEISEIQQRTGPPFSFFLNDSSEILKIRSRSPNIISEVHFSEQAIFMFDIGSGCLNIDNIRFVGNSERNSIEMSSKEFYLSKGFIKISSQGNFFNEHKRLWI